MTSEKDAGTYLYRGFIALCIIIIILYAGFELRNLVKGPTISIDYPKNGATVVESLIELTGTAKNVSFLSLNDRPIFIDSKGTLREPVLLSSGYNVIRLRAEDRFGRLIEETVEILFKQPEEIPSSAPVPST